MNGAYRMDGMDGMGSGDQLERELRSWLRAFDPGDLTPLQRVRIHEDLEVHTRAGWRQSRTGRSLGRAVTLMTGLAVCALMVAAWLALGMGVSATGPGAPLPPVSPILPHGPGSGVLDSSRVNPEGLWAAVVASCVLAAMTLVPAFRRAVGRLLIGTEPEPVADLRSVREWRTVPRLAWTIVIVSAGYNAWWLSHMQLTGLQPLQQVRIDVLTVLYVVGYFVPALAIVLRYPFADRSTRLMVAAVLVPILSAAIEQIIPWGSLDEGQLTLAGAGAGLVAALSPWLLAAAMGRLAGFVGRPPRWLVATVVGLVVGMEWGFAADALWGPSSLYPDVVYMVVGQVPRALVLLGWLAIAWIGYDRSRNSSSPWPWRLVAIGGLATVINQLPIIVYNLASIFWPGAANPDNPYVLGGIDCTWLWDLSIVLSVGLAAGLLTGLTRPDTVREERDGPDAPDVAGELTA